MTAASATASRRRGSADLAWLQHVVHHLRDDGRGYVITATGPLFRGGAEGAIRSRMLGAGCVDTVIALPAKMLPQTSIALALWVLRAPRGAEVTEPTVRFIDASGIAAPDLPDVVADWLSADPRLAVDVPHTQEPVTTLLANDAVLTPQRWIDQEARDTDEIIDRITDATRTVDDVAGPVRTLPDVTSAVGL